LTNKKRPGEILTFLSLWVVAKPVIFVPLWPPSPARKEHTWYFALNFTAASIAAAMPASFYDGKISTFFMA
jgi:hypothetical protein